MLSISLPRQYRLLLLGVTIGLAPLAWISSPWALGVLLFLGGTAIAPTLTVQNTLVGSMAPEHATTEAFTWLSTITVGASAIGAAVGGALIEGPAGVSGSLVLAAAGAALAVAVTLVPGRRPGLSPGPRGSPSPPDVPLDIANWWPSGLMAATTQISAATRGSPPAWERLRAAGSLSPRWLRGDSDPGRLRLVRSMAPHC